MRVGALDLPRGVGDYQLAVLQHVLAEDAAGGHHRSIAHPHRADSASLPAQEDGGLVEHDATRHIAEERGRGLVTVGCEVEVDIRAAHLGVVLAAGPSGHEAVAEVDETSQGYEGKQDSL